MFVKAVELYVALSQKGKDVSSLHETAIAVVENPVFLRCMGRQVSVWIVLHQSRYHHSYKSSQYSSIVQTVSHLYIVYA